MEKLNGSALLISSEVIISIPYNEELKSERQLWRCLETGKLFIIECNLYKLKEQKFGIECSICNEMHSIVKE